MAGGWTYEPWRGSFYPPKWPIKRELEYASRQLSSAVCIGGALAGREVARYLREIGAGGGGPAPLTKQDRSRFLSALDTALQAALRVQS